MTSNKRKSDDVFTENDAPSVVVVGNGNGNASMSQLKTQLQIVRQQNEGDDAILAAMETIDQDDGDAEESLMEEANRIKCQLERQLQSAKNACQQESSVLRDLANRMDSMHQKRKSLLQDMEQLDQRQVELQRKISMHQEEASQEIESIDQVEEERKRQVPRLKTQISLYASTTGIKWDFAQDDILSGSVVRRIRRNVLFSGA